MHRVMRRGALVADCVVLWLRFAEAADLDRYCACCRANAASFRDLRLAIAGVGPAPPRDAELRVVCDAPRVGVLAQFLAPLERRWLVALGRAAATSPVRARLRARKLRAKHYVNLDERAFWLPDASRALLRRVGQRVEALTRCPRTADDGFELHYTPAGHDAFLRTLRRLRSYNCAATSRFRRRCTAGRYGLAGRLARKRCVGGERG